MARNDKTVAKHRKVLLDANTRTDSELKTGRPTPIASFLALLLAFLLVFAALGLLLAINHQAVWPGDGIFALVQPASILSLILSFISIFIGFAYSNGVTYAWWRIQQKPGTNPDDLQDAYDAGDSILGALRYCFHFFWISLACLSLLLLTLNSFVLQGAISTRLVTQTDETPIRIPVLRQLDLGFSSPPSTTVYNTDWARIWQQVLNIDGISFTNYAFFGNISNQTGQAFDFGYKNGSTYNAEIEGAGFDAVCNTSTNNFDFTPSDSETLTTGRVFTTLVSWDSSLPNDIRLEISYKNTSACSGELITRACRLRAATVVYPVQVQTQLAGTAYQGPFYSLRRRPPGQIDRTVEILPVYDGEGSNETWTYKGIAETLSQTFNSSITVTSSFDTATPGDITIEGQFAYNLGPKYPDGWQYQCNMSFDEGLRDLAYFQLIATNEISPFVQRGVAPTQSADPAEIILERLRQAMFLASIYSGSSAFGSAFHFSLATQNNSVQEVPSTQSTQVAQYEARLYLWGVSVAITYIVILCVLPLFWAYWRLTRHPDASPVDFARAFRKSGTIQAGTSPQAERSAINGDIEKKKPQPTSRQASGRLKKK